MADRIKVYNPQKFNVGIKLQDKPNGVNIAAGTHIQMTQEEIDYVMAIGRVFQRGFLRIEASEEKETMLSMGIDVDTDPNFTDDDEIRKKLGQTVASVKKWIATIEEPYLLDRIYDIAIEMDLPMNKVKVLKEKMPDKSFLDE